MQTKRNIYTHNIYIKYEPKARFPSEGSREEMKPISIIHKSEKKENAFNLIFPFEG